MHRDKSSYRNFCVLKKPLFGVFAAIMALQPVCDRAVAGYRQPSDKPRLFFTSERQERLKADIAGDDISAAAWRQMLERADDLAKADLVSKEYSEGGKGQHGNYGQPSSQIAEMAGTLGLAYHMTGDVKYAKKLRDAMLHYGTFSRWAGDANNDPPWHSELNTARFCYGYAVAYDSIRGYLSEAERKQITDSMVRLGIRPTLDDWVLGDKRIHALDSMGHNWWSVCVAMAGLASLSVVGDVDQADDWARTISDAFEEWFLYNGNVLQNKCINFDPKGGFYESVSYANYALSEYLLFRLAWGGVYPDTPAPQIDLLDKAGDFFIHTCYPTSDSMLAANFGDSSIKSGGTHTIRLLMANGYDDKAYPWYVNRTDRGLKDPIALACGLVPSVDKAPEDLAKSFAYNDIGWAMMRSSWADDATMLAVKSGFAWNHAHPDAGSFILLHKGKPLLIDSGNCSYSRPEYSGYYRKSHAHNVVLTDGHAGNPEACGPDRGVVTPGKVHNLLDLGDLKYVLADATGPTAWKFSRNYRHFIWLDKVILIFDDIRTHDPGKLEWLLHYDSDAEVKDSTIEVSNGDDAGVIVRMLYPQKVTVAEKTGLRDHDPDTEVRYLALSPPEPTREAKFITALLPVGDGGVEDLPKLELLQANDAIGVRVSDGDTVTDVYFNLRADGRKMHRNSCNTINGWETDACIFAVTRGRDADDEPDSTRRYLIASGSYLRKDGKVALDSLSKVYCAFAEQDGRMQVQLSGQPLINAAIRALKKPAAVTLNGDSTSVRYNRAASAVELKLDSR